MKPIKIEMLLEGNLASGLSKNSMELDKIIQKAMELKKIINSQGTNERRIGLTKALEDAIAEAEQDNSNEGKLKLLRLKLKKAWQDYYSLFNPELVTSYFNNEDTLKKLRDDAFQKVLRIQSDMENANMNYSKYNDFKQIKRTYNIENQLFGINEDLILDNIDNAIEKKFYSVKFEYENLIKKIAILKNDLLLNQKVLTPEQSEAFELAENLAERKYRNSLIKLYKELPEQYRAFVSNQIALDYEKEVAEIEARRKEFAELNASAGLTGLDAMGLTEAQAAEIARAEENAAARRKAELAGIYEELAGQYKTYAEQRLEIEAKYDAEIGALREARRQAEAAGDREAAERLGRGIAEATRARGKALLEHDFGVLRESPEYVRAFEDLRNTSTETLEGLRGELERLKGTAAGVLTPQELREYTTTLGEIMAEIDSRDPLGTLARRARELGEAEGALAEARGRLERVQRGERVFTGLKVESVDAQGRPKVVATYLSAADALRQYTAAKDRHRKASNEYEKAEKTATDTVKGLTEAIKGAGESLGDTAGMAVGLIMDMGMFVSDTIKGIETVARTGEDAVSAVEKASVILAMVSAALQLLHRISELGNGAHAEYEAYAAKVDEINALTRAVTDYRLAVLEARQEESRWFTEDGLGELRRWKEYHDEVWRAYVEKAGEAQAVYHNESGGGWLTGAINWLTGNLSALSWWKEWRDIWGQGGYDEGTTAAINNLRIETRKKSSGFLGTGIGGHSQKTEDLATWARRNGLGELFDEKGLINKELAQSLIDNYGNKLVGQTKETLEALMELRERYDEYVEKLHEYVSSMYEPLVDNFVDSLWDWLDNGKDALDSFKEYASDTFRDIVTDMLRTIVLDKVVGTYSDDISALYEKYAEGKMSEEELMRQVAALTGGLIDRYGSNLPTLENVLTTVAGMFDQAGIDISGSEGHTQSGKAGAFTAMSQDQGTKLEGLMTSVQGHVAHIDGWLTEDVSARMSAAEGYLARIAENTKANAEQAEEIKELIVQLIRDGLKMR